MRMALPLIVSNSFWTLQITIDRMLLGQYSSTAVAAAIAAAVLFWAPFALVQNTANYATTFVAQYLGAGRPERIGPAVWQALHFSLLAGAGFMLLAPTAGWFVSLGGHTAALQEQETAYLRCLCFATLPMLVTAAAGSFFIGRGRNWTVVFINAAGTVVNAVLDYAWIGGHWGFPEWGIAGAGWATVVGSYVSAALAVVLLLLPEFRREFATLAGWRPERELFGRLMYYGLPSGLQWTLDILAFAFLVFLIGRMGETELAASSVAFTLNMLFVLPMLGMGQAVGVLVGQRLGADQPDLAERSAWAGFKVTWLYMAGVAFFYLITPGLLVEAFRPRDPAEAERWAAVAAMVPVLLRFVALYTLFDGINLIFSFALKGAGDTRFVTAVMLVLPWPVMVLPTWAAVHFGWGLYWAWAFASAYIICLAVTFLLRFLGGRWKSMRVIEAAPPEEAPAPEPCGSTVE
jgi:MATE family multidrug resistance protein